MRLWEKLSGIIQIVYRKGREAEASVVKHTAAGSSFFDYSDRFADERDRVGDEYDPDMKDETSRRRLIGILEGLKQACMDTAESYADMGRALETCIVMVREWSHKGGSS